MTRDLLRSPGESLRGEIENANWDVAGYVAFAPLLPMSLYAAYVSDAAFAGKFAPLWVALLYLIAAITGLAWLVFKLWRLLVKRRQLTLGYEAELAVGQELSQLANNGFRVFHDIPARTFNVDHVVVGRAGVFAVETKGRTKPLTVDGRTAAWKVKYDGVDLDFSGWRTKAPIQQAVWQARWLGEWLSEAVGEQITARAVVVFPGWLVSRAKEFPVEVMGGGEILERFPTLETESPLNDQLIKRIAYQLDQRCRNVEPHAYRHERHK